MNSRERFLRVMRYEPVDRRVYGVMTGAWPETVERWRREGYDPAAPPRFDTDRWDWQADWFFPDPPFERAILEEDESTVLYRNHEGIVMRERKDEPFSSMPQFVRFPVTSREEFRRFARERMRPDLASRIGADYRDRLQALRGRDSPLIVIANRWGGFFGGLRAMVGVERLCTLFHDDPAWVEEMMDSLAEFLIAMLDGILAETDIEAFGFWEDMAYRSGPLVSPGMARRFMLPRYRRVVEFARSRGVEFIALDSDGDISALIPVWLDAGINVLYPFEVQAGMDVVATRRRFGRDLRLWGGIDKRALAEGPAAIDAEINRVRPLIEEGGYVAAPDHSLPPDVPYAHFLHYMQALLAVL